MKHRIYSDFNGPYYPSFMLLNYQGTQEDLEDHRIDLVEGMPVTVYANSDEEEDLELDGIVRYGSIPGTDYAPCWYADTRGSRLRYVKRQ